MEEKKDRSWTTPTVVEYGSVEELTARDKWRGADDGFVLQPDGVPIGS